MSFENILAEALTLDFGGILEPSNGSDPTGQDCTTEPPTCGASFVHLQSLSVIAPVRVGVVTGIGITDACVAAECGICVEGTLDHNSPDIRL